MSLSRRRFLTKLPLVSAAGYVAFRAPATPSSAHVADPPRGVPRGRYLIVNADDFGADDAINRGVIEAHERGIVTSASFMVDMPGGRSALRLAKEHPRLSLGLHANFTAGDRVVPLADIRAVRRELERQFDTLGTSPATRPRTSILISTCTGDRRSGGSSSSSADATVSRCEAPRR
jgi:hypothetical protein